MKIASLLLAAVMTASSLPIVVSAEDNGSAATPVTVGEELLSGFTDAAKLSDNVENQSVDDIEIESGILDTADFSIVNVTKAADGYLLISERPNDSNKSADFFKLTIDEKPVAGRKYLEPWQRNAGSDR